MAQGKTCRAFGECPGRAAGSGNQSMGFGLTWEAGFVLLHFFKGLNSGNSRKKSNSAPTALSDDCQIILGGKRYHSPRCLRPASSDIKLPAHTPGNFRVGGAFNRHAGCRTIQANGANHRHRLPMAGRSAGMHPFSLRSTTAQTSQIGFGSRFIQKNQPRRIEAALPPPPRPPRFDNVGAVLLAGAESLFLYVSPIFSKT